MIRKLLAGIFSLVLAAGPAFGVPGVFQKIVSGSTSYTIDPEDGGVIIPEGAILLAAPHGSSSISATASDGTIYTLGAESTVGYKFVMNMTAGTNYWFVKNFDDAGHIRIVTPDGTTTNTVLNCVTWDAVRYGSYTPTSTGWHTLFVYCGNGSGGIGPTTAPFTDDPYASILWNDTGVTSCTAENRDKWHRFVNTDSEGTYLYTCTNGIGIAGSPAQFGTPVPAYGSYEPHAGETLAFSCPTAYTNDAQGVAARLLGYSYALMSGETYVGTAASTSIVWSAENEGSTLTWLWERSYRVTVTNLSGEAVLSDDGGATYASSLSAWVAEGDSYSVTVADTSCRRVAWVDVPSGTTTGARGLTATFSSIASACAIRAESFTPTHVWTGGAGTSDWNTSANWDQSGGQSPVPIDDSIVFVPAAASAGTTNRVIVTAPVTIGGLYVGRAFGDAAGQAVFEAQTLGTNAISGALRVYANGLLTHTRHPTTATAIADEAYKLNVSAASCRIEAGGEVNVTGCGFRSGKGPGYSDGSHPRSAYGGYACGEGRHYGYGSLRYPVNLGSGGDWDTDKAGGGAVCLSVSGTLAVDGLIVSDGLPLPTVLSDYKSGTGGSILLFAGTLTGSGTIRANGGRCGGANLDSGSGGRIAVHQSVATDFSAFTGRIVAASGEGGIGRKDCHAGPGTVYLRTADEAEDEGTLVIDNDNRGYTSCSAAITAGSGEFTVGSLVVTNGAYFYMPDTALHVKRDLRTETGTVVYDYNLDSLRHLGTIVFESAHDHHVTGTNAFGSLTCLDPGSRLYFGTSSRDFCSIGAGGTLAIQGAKADPVWLLPDDPDAAWRLPFAADAYVNVQYAAISNCNATGTLTPEALDSRDLGGNVNWTFAASPELGITPTHVWTGTADDDFFNAANWTDPDGAAVAAPGPAAVVHIPASSTYGECNTVVATGAIRVATLYVGTPRAMGSACFEARTLETNAVSGNVRVLDGGILTHTETPASANTLADECYKLNLAAGGDITVDAGGEVDADGCGFQKQKGPTYKGGHGRSAHGGFSLGEATGKGYGSMRYPVNLGTGGQHSGFNGGGAVMLSAGGTLTVNGKVHADGLPRTKPNEAYCANATGGSVLLMAGTFAGSGRISACGAFANTLDSGSGGRIAVHQSVAKDFSAWSGRIVAASGEGSASRYDCVGGPGTIYLRTADEAEDEGTLVIDNDNLGYTECTAYITEGSGEFTVGSLVVTNGGWFCLPRLEPLRVKRDVLLRGGTVKPFYSFSGSSNNRGSIVFASNLVHVVTGTATYNSFVCTDPGTTFRFGTTADDHVTVYTGTPFTMVGSEASPISLLPLEPTETWTITLQTDAQANVRYACVSNSVATEDGLGITAYDSRNLGGNVRWGFAKTITPGDPITWTGASADGDWNNAANWLDGYGDMRTPEPTDCITLPADAAPYPVFTAGLIAANALTIAEGASLTLSGGNLSVTNLLRVAGTLTATGSETITCSNAVDFTGGAFAAASSRLILTGDLAQSVELADLAFDRVEVRKSGGSVTWASGFSARRFVTSPTGALTMTFASGETVAADEFFAFGATPGVASSLALAASDASAWKLNARTSYAVGNLTVTRCAATGCEILADTTCSDGGGNSRWIFNGNMCTWLGGTDNNNFRNAANWSPAVVPGPDTRVVLMTMGSDTKTISLPAGEDVTISNLMCWAADGAVTFTANARLHVLADADVGPGATLTLNAWADGAHEVGGDVIVREGGLVTHDKNGASPLDGGNQIHLCVGGDLSVLSGGAVDVTSRGQSGGSTSGDYGAPHGGVLSDMTGKAYGSVKKPREHGMNGSQSAGGGTVVLDVAGEVYLDGVIAANGGDSTWHGTGAGGSIDLTCASLRGSGAIQANGGCPLPNWARSGGGGRVAVRYRDSQADAAFTGAIEARAVTGPSAGGYAHLCLGAGTVYEVRPGYRVEKITVSNGGLFYANAYTDLPMAADGPASKAYKHCALVLTNGATVRVTADMAVKDLLMASANTRLILGTNTVYVRTTAHKDRKGWASGVTVTTETDPETGVTGQIIWRNPQTILKLR